MSIHTNVSSSLACVDQRAQVGLATRRVEVEAQLGQLDGNVAVQPGRTSRRQHLDVVTGHVVGLHQIGDVLAQLGEHRADAMPAQFCRRGKGVLEPFTGHEPPDGLPDERHFWRALTKPPGCRDAPAAGFASGPSHLAGKLFPGEAAERVQLSALIFSSVTENGLAEGRIARRSVRRLPAVELVTSVHGSTFYLCRLSFENPRFQSTPCCRCESVGLRPVRSAPVVEGRRLDAERGHGRGGLGGTGAGRARLLGLRARSGSCRFQGVIDFGDDSPRGLSRVRVLQDRPSHDEIVRAKVNGLARGRVPLVIVGGRAGRPDPGADNQRRSRKSLPADLNSLSGGDDAVAAGFDRCVRSAENVRFEVLFVAPVPPADHRHRDWTETARSAISERRCVWPFERLSRPRSSATASIRSASGTRRCSRRTCR